MKFALLMYLDPNLTLAKHQCKIFIETRENCKNILWLSARVTFNHRKPAFVFVEKICAKIPIFQTPFFCTKITYAWLEMFLEKTWANIDRIFVVFLLWMLSNSHRSPKFKVDMFETDFTLSWKSFMKQNKHHKKLRKKP